jgi:CheY-like chemotaxis protein
MALTAICCINFAISNWHILQLKRLQETALVEDRAMLLAQVSHDMKQPIHALNMLNGLVDDALVAHLDQGNDGEDELVGCTADSRRMRDVLAHLMSLADDFLVFSSMNSSSTFSLRLARTTLSEVCKRVEMVSGTLATEKGSTFVVSFGTGMLSGLPIMCDSTRLTQVLTNLSSNGLQYTPAGGSVELRLEMVPEFPSQLNTVSVRFSVVDSGSGMSATEVGQVFQPFHRGAAGGYEKGTGLGLAISKSLVEKMGGAITIQSELGKGSTFSFLVNFDPAPSLLLEAPRGCASVSQSPQIANLIPVMPLSGAEFTLDSERDTPLHQKRPLRFLVVDDNALNKRLFERTVDQMLMKQKRNRPVYTFASNGLEAVELFAESVGRSVHGSAAGQPNTSIHGGTEAFTSTPAFDCIFMDREMPVMDGVQATRRIVAMQEETIGSNRVPVIGVSASVESADIWKAAGMSYLLGKPFARKEMGHVLALVFTFVRLLHCCYTVVTFLLECWHWWAVLLHCSYVLVTLSLHCCYIVVPLLSHCCQVDKRRAD